MKLLYYYRGFVLILITFFYRLFFFGINCKIKYIGRRVTFNGNIQLSDGVRIRNDSSMSGDITIGSNSIFGENVELLAFGNRKIVIGSNVSISRNSIIRGNVIIKDRVLIGPNCLIVGGNHNISSRNTMITDSGVTNLGIIIESNVWLGGNVSVVDGVTIGEGSVIGAGAVVTKNIPPYSIAVGNPAKVIKTRDLVIKD